MLLSFWLLLVCVPFVSWWLAGVYIQFTDAPLEEVRRKISTVIENIQEKS